MNVHNRKGQHNYSLMNEYDMCVCVLTISYSSFSSISCHEANINQEKAHQVSKKFGVYRCMRLNLSHLFKQHVKELFRATTPPCVWELLKNP